MCGIVGIVRPGQNDPVPDLEDALKILKHRGPDDSGIWSDIVWKDQRSYSIGLGHTRLSIIDLSERGHQPMAGMDNLIIILNGEIYNYLELKKQLSDSGYQFKTDTDTEVALNAFHCWGEKCVERFIGMWAIAVWDGKQLFLSRDRLGKKPLYYHFNSDTGFLAFASEIKAFKEIRGVPWQPDERTVYRYLAFGEMEREGATFYSGIKELSPGCSMSFSPGQKQITPCQFWSISDDQIDIDEREAILKTSELLYDSVRLRLRSDAPIGLSLSGGLDSSILLAIVNELGSDSVPVFTAGYKESGYNETEFIHIANDYFNCQPYFTKTGAENFVNDFEKLIYHLDQPSKLPGPYSQWRVAELAGNHVKVLIDGQGADELAGGYMYFLPVMWKNSSVRNKIKQLPDLIATIFANRHMFSQYPLSVIWERISGKRGFQKDLPLQKQWRSNFTAERPEWENIININDMIRKSIVSTSLPALLRYGDRNTMAFGVENRCPFLDHRLVEFVASLPANMKIRNGTTKWIFRTIARGRIPDKIFKRRLKMGFPTPVGEWLRNQLRITARQWLRSYEDFDHFSSWVDSKDVLSIFDEHASGKRDHHALLWRILSVGAWLKNCRFGSNLVKKY